MIKVENQNDIFLNFNIEENAPTSVIENYNSKVPSQVIDIWKKHGFGSILQGYLKIINPHELSNLLKDVYVRHNESIPLFVTSMGDIIVWEKGRYLNLLNFRRNRVDVISASFDFFLEDLNDNDFLSEDLNWLPYPDAVQKYGEPSFNECFAYVPLLGLGGPEKVENLEKVKFVEHIYLITQFMGPIE